MKNIATETKVGIFMILGILVLGYFTVRVGRIAVREEGYRIYSSVESAAGLDKNSPVRIAGVEIGKVQEIILDGSKAKVLMHLPQKVKIPLGSKVFVKASGLLGEKYIEIVPGPGPQVVAANGQLEEGGPSIDVDRVLTQLGSIEGDIKSVTQSLSRVLGGEKGEQSMQELISGAKETMTNLQKITTKINKGEGTLGKLVKDDKLYKEAKETVSSLNQVAQSIEKGQGTLGMLVKDDTLYKDAKETIASLNQVSQAIEKGEGTLGKLVKDETLYNEAKETLTTLSKVSKDIESGQGTLGKLVKDETLYNEAKEAVASLSKISKDIESGQGTLGKLVKDETLYDETKRAIKSVNKAAEGIQEVTPVTVLGVILGLVIR